MQITTHVWPVVGVLQWGIWLIEAEMTKVVVSEPEEVFMKSSNSGDY